MTAEGRRSAPSPEDVLSPNNFLSYLGATTRIYRLTGGGVALLFIFGGIAVALAIGALLENFGGSGRTTVLAFFAQIVFLTLLGSLMSARANLQMAGALAGGDATKRTSPTLRGMTSHILAASMLASLLALFTTSLLGLLGAIVGIHMMLGPPVISPIIILERDSFSHAIRRARGLVRGQALRTFLYVLCAGLFISIVELVVIRLGLTAVAGSLNGIPETLAVAAVIGGVLGLGLSFMSAFNLIAYFDMRTRSEDFDLEDLRGDLDDERTPALEESPPEEADSEEA